MQQLALPGFEQLARRPVPQAVLEIASEASGSSRLAEQRVEEAAQMFRNAGISVLGNGCYSVVVPHVEDDKVVKLTMMLNDGFAQYAEWIRDLDTADRERFGPNLPVIHESFEHGGVLVTVMERLHPIKDRDGWRDEIPELYDALARAPDGYWNDLGYRNVMQRANGTLVVTDPWAGGDDDEVLDEDECQCSDCRLERGES